MQDLRGGLVSDRAKSADHHRAEATNGSGSSGRRALALVAALSLLLPAGSLAAVTAAQKCEGGKNDASGKYAACMAKAEKSLVQGGSLGSYDSAQLKCAEKYAGTWTKLEGGGSCPTTGDDSSIQDFLDACVLSVADALGGGTLPPDVVTCNADLTTCDGDLVTCEGDLTTCDGDLSTCEGDLATTEGDLATCDGDLAACEALPAVQAFKTGQITCWDPADTSSPIATISCAGSGQDGEIQNGVALSYTDNGDGTITDNETGLMWEKLDDNNLAGLAGIHDYSRFYTWAQAFVKISDLNLSVFAGHSDWRLPSIRELETLKDYGRVTPSIDPAFNTSCTGGCTVATCSCTQSDAYWSSSTYQFNPSGAWRVDFDDGNTNAYGKTGTNFVRAVRAGS